MLFLVLKMWRLLMRQWNIINQLNCFTKHFVGTNSKHVQGFSDENGKFLCIFIKNFRSSALPRWCFNWTWSWGLENNACKFSRISHSILQVRLAEDNNFVFVFCLNTTWNEKHLLRNSTSCLGGLYSEMEKNGRKSIDLP